MQVPLDCSSWPLTLIYFVDKNAVFDSLLCANEIPFEAAILLRPNEKVNSLQGHITTGVSF